jgi:nitroreductase
MDALQAISKRRSIRSYKNEQIPDSALEKILAAGSCAPVAGSFQMSVIQNPELLKKINDITKKAMLSSGIPFSVERASLPGYEPLYGAPTLIVLLLRCRKYVNSRNGSGPRLLLSGIPQNGI